jgi:hypothetical protein
VELPKACIELWSWFLQLNESRTSNGFGFNPLSYSDIAAFFHLRQVVPEQEEIDLIRRLDRTVLAVYSAKQKADSKKSSKK